MHKFVPADWKYSWRCGYNCGGCFHMYQRNYEICHLKWEEGGILITRSCLHLGVENTNYQIVFYKKKNSIFARIFFQIVCIQIMYITRRLSVLFFVEKFSGDLAN